MTAFRRWCGGLLGAALVAAPVAAQDSTHVRPFIQSAQITAYADGPTDVRLDVFTVDELAGEIGLAVQARAPLVSQFRVSNANLFGEAFRATAEWARSPGYRDRFGGEIEDFQILGHPWVADARAQLDHVSGYIEGTLSHPYFTDLQRIGWRVAAGSNHSYFGFRRDVGSWPTLDLERDYANAGGRSLRSQDAAQPGSAVTPTMCSCRGDWISRPARHPRSVRGGVQTEARRDTRNDHWDGVITSGRLAWYLKPSPRQTVILSADVAEGQRVRVPFQLALGDHDGGVRGYGGSNAAGNTRAVGRPNFAA